jgi:hypothetical protein
MGKPEQPDILDDNKEATTQDKRGRSTVNNGAKWAGKGSMGMNTGDEAVNLNEDSKSKNNA